MAGTPKLLAQFSPTNANSVLATVPANKRWVLSTAHMANTDASQRTLRLNHVQNGDSPAVKNRLIPDSPFPVGDFAEALGGIVMAAGDTIQGLSDVTTVFGVGIYGLEESTS